MPKFLFSIFLIFFSILCDAQGSWNIGYIPVDSISSKNIGQIVRIDFKSSNPWIAPDGHRPARSYVGMRDTGILTIDETIFIFAERRKIYSDHGSYREQYLECLNCKQGSLFIYDTKILDADPLSIQFQLEMETKKTDNTVQKELKIIRIDRNKLDGIMYKL